MNSSKLLGLLGAVLALLAMAPKSAKAAMYDISYVGLGYDVSLVAVITTGAYDADINAWQVIGMTGTRNGVAISGIVPNPNFPGHSIDGMIGFDNALFADPLNFGVYGLYYQLVDNTKWNLFALTNIFDVVEKHYFEVQGGGLHGLNSISFEGSLQTSSTVTVPEIGATGAMLAAALIFMAYLGRRTQAFSFGAGAMLR